MVFDSMIPDMLSIKETYPNSNSVIYQRQKTKHFSCFYSQSYFAVPKDIRLTSTHYFIMKIPN